MASARFVFTLGAQWGCKVRHGEVPNAFFRAPIDSTIYVKLSHGSPNEGVVYRLLKSLYRLEQSGRLWDEQICTFLLECELKQSHQDPPVYLKHEPLGTTVVGLYLDNVIFIAQDDSLSDAVMQQLHTKFEINDLSLISKCIGNNVKKQIWLFGTPTKHHRCSSCQGRNVILHNPLDINGREAQVVRSKFELV